MLKQKFVFIMALCVVITTHAEMNSITCPTIQEIKQGQLNYWLPLYQEGEELASTKDTTHFMLHIVDFDVAKWSTEYLENAHCFYRGNDPIVTRITLAQDAWQPTNHSKWIWIIAKKSAECRSSNNKDCSFIQ